MTHPCAIAFAFLTVPILSVSMKAQTTHNLVTGSSSFSPSLLTIQPGDIMNISVNPGHTCTEVTQATWDANGTTSNGGFNYSPGTHQLVLTVPGTYYFVCQIHVFMGMKGRIIVEAGTGVSDYGAASSFSVAPNPASDNLTVQADPATAAFVSLIDVQGREVLRRKVKGSDTVSITHLAAGDYTIALLDAQGIIREQKRLRIVR
ncbi:MAG: T9SS type A sorting domain-containing protein [Flavobacteriales bacterium]|nr:T9SS type A sorting domain-containing protein [Flavobacteriales bacterium]